MFVAITFSSIRIIGSAVFRHSLNERGEVLGDEAATGAHAGNRCFHYLGGFVAHFALRFGLALAARGGFCSGTTWIGARQCMLRRIARLTASFDDR